MQKSASKNIISSGSYEFLNMAQNTITRREVPMTSFIASSP